MSYEFERIDMGAFIVHKTVAAPGVVHRKRFIVDGATPANQGTLNLYAGPFRVSIEEAEFTQDMGAGQSSLDLAIGQFPLMAICEEVALEDGAVRYCVVPAGPWRWRRYAADIDGARTLAGGSVVFPVSGELLIDGRPAQLHTPAAGFVLAGVGRALILEVVA